MQSQKALPLKGSGKVTKRLRAVFDTNVFISASLSKNANSPTRELLERWKKKEFTLIICDQIAKELIEKLVEKDISSEDIDKQISALASAAEWVIVPEEKIESLLSDPDDNVIVACAVEGGVNYLVTYDPHFDSLQGEYRGVKIVKAIPFLEALRKK
jgi:uncharacterized protein